MRSIKEGLHTIAQACRLSNRAQGVQPMPGNLTPQFLRSSPNGPLLEIEPYFNLTPYTKGYEGQEFQPHDLVIHGQSPIPEGRQVEEVGNDRKGVQIMINGVLHILWNLSLRIPDGWEKCPTGDAQKCGLDITDHTRYPIRLIRHPNYHGPFPQSQSTPTAGTTQEWLNSNRNSKSQAGPFSVPGTPGITATPRSVSFESVELDSTRGSVGHNLHQRDRRAGLRSPGDASTGGESRAGEGNGVQRQHEIRSRSNSSSAVSTPAPTPSSSALHPSSIAHGEVRQHQAYKTSPRTDNYRSNAGSRVSTPVRSSPLAVVNPDPPSPTENVQQGRTPRLPNQKVHRTNTSTHRPSTEGHNSNTTSAVSTPTKASPSSVVHSDRIPRAELQQDHQYRTPSKRMDNTIPPQDPTGLVIPSRSGVPKRPSQKKTTSTLFTPPVHIPNQSSSPSGSIDLRARLKSSYSSTAPTPNLQYSSQIGSPTGSVDGSIRSPQIEGEVYEAGRSGPNQGEVNSPRQDDDKALVRYNRSNHYDLPPQSGTSSRAPPSDYPTTPQMTSTPPAFHDYESPAGASPSNHTSTPATHRSNSSPLNGPSSSINAPVESAQAQNTFDHNNSSQQGRNTGTPRTRSEHQRSPEWTPETSSDLSPIHTPRLTSPPKDIPDGDYFEAIVQDSIYQASRQRANVAALQQDTSTIAGPLPGRLHSPLKSAAESPSPGTPRPASKPQSPNVSASRASPSHRVPPPPWDNGNIPRSPSGASLAPQHRDGGPETPQSSGNQPSPSSSSATSTPLSYVQGFQKVREKSIRKRSQSFLEHGGVRPPTPYHHSSGLPGASPNSSRGEASRIHQAIAQPQPQPSALATGRMSRQMEEAVASPDISGTHLTPRDIGDGDGQDVQNDVDAQMETPATQTSTLYDEPRNRGESLGDTNPTTDRRHSGVRRSSQLQDAQTGVNPDSPRPRATHHRSIPTKEPKIGQETLAVAIKLAHTVRPIVEDAMQKLHFWYQCLAPLRGAFEVEGTLAFYDCFSATLERLRQNLLGAENLLGPTARPPGVQTEWLDRYIEHLAALAEVLLKWVGSIPSDFALDYIGNMTSIMAAYTPYISQLVGQFEGLFHRLQAERITELAESPIHRRPGAPRPRILRFDEPGGQDPLKHMLARN